MTGNPNHLCFRSCDQKKKLRMNCHAHYPWKHWPATITASGHVAEKKMYLMTCHPPSQLEVIWVFRKAIHDQQSFFTTASGHCTRKKKKALQYLRSLPSLLQVRWPQRNASGHSTMKRSTAGTAILTDHCFQPHDQLEKHCMTSNPFYCHFRSCDHKAFMLIAWPAILTIAASDHMTSKTLQSLVLQVRSPIRKALRNLQP